MTPPPQCDQVMAVTTEQDWDRLVHTAGLVLVDVYSGWCGPCSSMEAHLKRLRVASIMAEDRVSLARACCDNIEELAPFRKDPRPTWYYFQNRNYTLASNDNVLIYCIQAVPFKWNPDSTAARS